MHGPSRLARQILYSFYYHRHEKRRAHGRSATGDAGTMITLWGHDFELPLSNAGIAEELRLFGVHEPEATAEYQRRLRPQDHVVDIGANVGYYLLAAAQIVQAGRIVAFEPVPSNYAILKRNLDRFGLKHCHHWPWAIGARNEAAVFFESNVSNFGGLIEHNRQDLKREITVEVRRLDDVIDTLPAFRPTVLRMDVEGAELQVLAGAERVLRTCKPLLFIEFHPFAIGLGDIMKALDGLRSLGYDRGVLIDRLWDQPWIASWSRRRRCWHGDLRAFSQLIPAQTANVFTLILDRPAPDL